MGAPKGHRLKTVNVRIRPTTLAKYTKRPVRSKVLNVFNNVKLFKNSLYYNFWTDLVLNYYKKYNIPFKLKDFVVKKKSDIVFNSEAELMSSGVYSSKLSYNKNIKNLSKFDNVNLINRLKWSDRLCNLIFDYILFKIDYSFWRDIPKIIRKNTSKAIRFTTYMDGFNALKLSGNRLSSIVLKKYIQYIKFKKCGNSILDIKTLDTYNKYMYNSESFILASDYDKRLNFSYDQPIQKEPFLFGRIKRFLSKRFHSEYQEIFYTRIFGKAEKLKQILRRKKYKEYSVKFEGSKSEEILYRKKVKTEWQSKRKSEKKHKDKNKFKLTLKKRGLFSF